MSSSTVPRGGDRAPLGAALRLSLTAAVTTWVALLSWAGFTDLATQFLTVLVVAGLLIAVLGALARSRRVPGVLVLAAQAVAGSVVVCLYVADRPYPGAAFWAAVDEGFASAQLYAAPVPSTAETTVQPLLAIGGLAALLLVDLLACTLRRVPLAGLPLLAVYSVPISMLGGGVPWWVFALTAWGFLVMLFLQEQEQVGRWGRSLDPSNPATHRSEAVRRSALLVGVLATGAAMLAPLAVPTFSLEVLDLGSGPGSNDQITIENPLTDLRRDLRRGDDIPLVEVVTDDPSPSHLRISVLNRFSDNEFSSGDRDVPAANVAEGTLPPLQGVSDQVAASATSYDYGVSVLPEFESRWLPTQAPIDEIDAPGDWRFDASTMDFLAGEDDLSTSGIDYRMNAVDYDFRPEDLRAAPLEADEVSAEVTALPDSLPPYVSQLARGVTSGQQTPYERAVALQQWFREDGGFTYSLENAPSAKVGTDELEAFLRADTGRVGYCEQFATAMAVMARALDIPARVSVGFLTPEQVGRDTYVYSAHDLHAWPELYFPGAGWVLFDPTPSARVPDGQLPAYSTRGNTPVIPSAEPEPEPAPAPTQRPPAEQPDVPTATPDDLDADGADGVDQDVPWLRVLLVLAVIGLLVALLLVPQTIRTRQRARRLAAGAGPESAWEELRATTRDLGQAWPDGRSPREVRAVLVDRFGRVGDTDQRPVRGPDQAPEAVEALDRVVTAIERSRYASSSSAPAAPLGDDVATCCAALTAGAAPRVQRRARWAPRSVMERRREPRPAATAPELADHL